MPPYMLAHRTAMSTWGVMVRGMALHQLLPVGIVGFILGCALGLLVQTQPLYGIVTPPVALHALPTTTGPRVFDVSGTWTLAGGRRPPTPVRNQRPAPQLAASTDNDPSSLRVSHAVTRHATGMRSHTGVAFLGALGVTVVFAVRGAFRRQITRATTAALADPDSTGDAVERVRAGLRDTHARIAAVCAQEGIAAAPTLVAVSKFQSLSALWAAYEEDHRVFGENYVQELLGKCRELPSDVQWHFIGHLQSNKVKALLEGCPNLEAIETVDSIKLANRLNRVATELKRPPLKVCAQFSALRLLWPRCSGLVAGVIGLWPSCHLQ